MKLRLYSMYLAFCSAGMLLGLTSCGDIEQRLIIRPDGSGTMETSFDIGEMMSMMQGLGDMGASDVTISADEKPDTTLKETEEAKDPMQTIMDQVTNPEYNRDFDTLISFLTLMPDSVKQKEARPDLASRISLRMKSPAKSSGLIIGIVMDFDNAAHLKEMVQYAESMDNAASPGVMNNAAPASLGGENFLVFDADLKAGWIRFDSVDYSGMAADFGMSADSLMTSEDMGMLEMMFGNSKIRSIIHVPGEVVSCTYKDAILTKDDRVIIEQGFIDLIKKGKMDGFTIHFKPKK